jgi:hypothetical protein
MAMTTGFVAIAVAAAPLGVIVGLLRLMDRLQRRRDARYARQIELTDAIHREMGAVAAPTVERRRGGGWVVRMRVPLDTPALVAAVLRITDQVFSSSDTRDTLQIVLTSLPGSPAMVAGPLRATRHRPLQSGASIIAAVR